MWLLKRIIWVEEVIQAGHGCEHPTCLRAVAGIDEKAKVGAKVVLVGPRLALFPISDTIQIRPPDP